MKKKIALVMILAMLGGTAVMAQHFGQGSPDGRRGHDMKCGQGGAGFEDRGFHFGIIMQLADKLELTDQQKDQIKNLMEKNGLERIEKKAELEKAELKMRNLKINDGDDSEILSAIDQVGKMKTEMQKMRFRHRSQIKSVLTDAQIDKLDSLKTEFHRNGPRCDMPCGGQGHGMGIRPDFDNDNSDDNPPLRPNCWRN